MTPPVPQFVQPSAQAPKDGDAHKAHAALAREFLLLAPAARERRSVDLFARAALGGFVWAVLGGVCGKLFWDSVRPPLFFYPLALLDLLCLWDAARSYLAARASLKRELAIEGRLREVRLLLGVDAHPMPAEPARASGVSR